MREKKYDIIFWDVDGTLLDFKKSEKWALREAFLSYEIMIDEEVHGVYSRINDSYWKRLERGELTRMEVLRGRFDEFFETLMPGGALAHKGIDAEKLAAVDKEQFRMKYQKNLGGVYFYMEDSISLCKKLREEGFLQYIITNGVEWTQRNKLQLAGFDRIMEEIFISETIGYDKPDVRFFDACLNAVKGKADKQRILVVGDSLTSDMKGAENAGLDCCLYQPDAEPGKRPFGVTYQISRLWDVEEVLWQNQRDRS